MYSMGRIIRFHRKKTKMTQSDLAKLSGVGKTVIFEIEKGKQSIQLNTLQKILNVLNVQTEKSDENS